MSRGPLAVAVGVSVGLHLLAVAVVLLVRTPANTPTLKRGEPLFVELPQVEESAQRGAPAAPSTPPKAPPTPPAPKAPPTPVPPAPATAKAQPEPKAAPTPPQPRAPEQPRVAAAVPEPPTPAGEIPREAPAPAPSNPAQPSVSEPTHLPEIPRQDPSLPSPPRVAAVPEPRPAVPDIRTALRRGGPGGAGGFGEGRGGITGTPIPMDTKDLRYSDYFRRIQQMIQAKMIYPCVKNQRTGECEYRSGQLMIEFGILRDGNLQFVEVVAAANYEIFDDYSVNAIKLAAPFPPVPDSLMATLKPGSSGVPVSARFVYVLESSFRGLVR